MNPILEGTQYVVENAQHVMIDKELLLILPIYGKNVPAWECDVHYNGTDSLEALWYVLVLDTLNFCFWNTPEKKWSMEYNGKKNSGYRALAASLRRAMDEEIPITNAYYLRAMPKQDLEHILRGQGELLLMDERVKALNELGSVLLEKYNGDPLHLLEEAGFDALSLAFVMTKEFSSFRDVAQYKGRSIPLLKRAQILAADIHGAKSYPLRGMDKITAFADYKLPQLLHAYGVLKYEQSLDENIRNGVELASGSEEEIEIRAATIQAVEMIKALTPLASYQIDWILWTTAKELSLQTHHQTRTIFY